MELAKKLRPRRIKDLVGQPNAQAQLYDWYKNKSWPHAIALTGPSGCGKTTVARIIRRLLKCGDLDYYEEDCGAVEEPIQAIREIKRVMGTAPLQGKVKVWLLDEMQAFSRARFAQQALLKILEEQGEHVYFIIATTEYPKVIQPIRTRCQEIKLLPLQDKVMREFVHNTWSAESGCEHNPDWEEVIERIVEISFGSPRQALQNLDRVMRLKSKKKQLDVLVPEDQYKQAFDVVRALVYTRPKWSEMVKILKEVDTSEPERLRHLILACARTEMLKGGKGSARAFLVHLVFSEPWYDCQESGLVGSCYNVLMDKTE